MSDDIQYPTADEAEQFSDEFDKIVDNTLAELNQSADRVRTDIIMSNRDEGESSPVRLGATLFVSQAVAADPEIKQYENPTDEQMHEILDRAANYTGTWYHSKVTLYSTGKWTPLQAKVAELDEESGVFLMFHYPSRTLTPNSR